ncbi:predicted protein [Histoplasma capsulatum var. duboisii H88]|uniref:Predicted protein n=1 Tax=Ajellomyces capsulatus (strain H88) TaxID=544711 RepID=F0ULN6_AJEC8|nr:predicted protein [Histoplasma capsulatum var. duboisii H88]
MSKEPEKRARGTGERTLWSQSSLDATKKHLDETLGERIAGYWDAVSVCQRMRKGEEEEEAAEGAARSRRKNVLVMSEPTGRRAHHHPERDARVNVISIRQGTSTDITPNSNAYRTVPWSAARHRAAAGHISSSIKQLQTILSAGSTRDGDAIGEGNQQVQSNQLQTIPGQQWTCSLGVELVQGACLPSPALICWSRPYSGAAR